MEKFIFLFRGKESGPDLPPDQLKAYYQKWYEWMEMLAKTGCVVASEPLLRTGKQVNGSNKVVTDGPFTEAKEIVGGYTIITAKDIDEAVEIAKGCPAFEVDGKVEVRPIQKMEM